MTSVGLTWIAACCIRGKLQSNLKVMSSVSVCLACTAPLPFSRNTAWDSHLPSVPFCMLYLCVWRWIFTRIFSIKFISIRLAAVHTVLQQKPLSLDNLLPVLFSCFCHCYFTRLYLQFSNTIVFGCILFYILRTCFTSVHKVIVLFSLLLIVAVCSEMRRTWRTRGLDGEEKKTRFGILLVQTWVYWTAGLALLFSFLTRIRKNSWKGWGEGLGCGCNQGSLTVSAVPCRVVHFVLHQFKWKSFRRKPGLSKTELTSGRNLVKSYSDFSFTGFARKFYST